MSFSPDTNLKQMNPQELKSFLAQHLSNEGLGGFQSSDNLKRPEGISTNVRELDQFLFWGGVPKSAVSLFCGSLGSGATSLWLEAATTVIGAKKWVAWINRDVPLSGLPLYHKGLDLERFVSIEPPTSENKIFWVLQELMSSSLFDLIGCDLGHLRLKEHQIRKLQTQARNSQIALVFLSQEQAYRGSSASVFSLILRFEKDRLLIERALHRPTPHSLPRSVTYARFTSHARYIDERVSQQPPSSLVVTPKR